MCLFRLAVYIITNYNVDGNDIIACKDYSFQSLTAQITDFNWLFHTYHGYVRRLNRVERNRVLDLDDRSQRSRLLRHILRILLEVAAY